MVLDKQTAGRRKRSQKSQRDETLTCEHCGVSFLWSMEEQRHQPGEPTYCHGCRVLLPGGGRERGVVKWYNARKNYGFIIRKDADDLFVHRSQLGDEGRVREGDLVEFAVEEGDKGLMAIDVRRLESN